MSDLVEWLRANTKCTDWDRDWGSCGRCAGCLTTQAADTIEALTAERAALRAERITLLHNKQINNAVQSAFEDGEIRLSSEGYAEALKGNPTND